MLKQQAVSIAGVEAQSLTQECRLPSGSPVLVTVVRCPDRKEWSLDLCHSLDLTEGCNTGRLHSKPNGHCDHKPSPKVSFGLTQQNNYFALGERGGGIFFKMYGEVEVKEVN